MAFARNSFTANGGGNPLAWCMRKCGWRIKPGIADRLRTGLSSALGFTVMVITCGLSVAHASSCTPGSTTLPSGSYLQSCSNAYVSGTTLFADCKDLAGSVAPSRQLTNCTACLPQSDIANYNGALHCNKGNMPLSGSYTQSCRFIYVTGTTLVANCKNASNQWAGDSVLPNMLSCVNGSVINVNGVIHCNSATPPRGSYQETCNLIWYYDGVLNANCRTSAGAWRSTSIATSANAVCSNQNGNLRCP